MSDVYEQANAVDDTAQPGSESVPTDQTSRNDQSAHLVEAALALVAGAALTELAHLSAVALLVGVAITQCLVAVSWTIGTRAPTPIGSLVLGAAAAVGADVAVSLRPHGQLGTLLAVLGLALPVMFAYQLMRGVARSQVVASLASIAVLIAVEIALAALLQLRHESVGTNACVAVISSAALALVVGHCADLVTPLGRFDPQVSRGVLAMLLGAVAAAVLAQLWLRHDIDFAGARALFLGFSVGAVAGVIAIGMAFMRYDSEPEQGWARRLQPVYAVLIPLCFTAPLGYLLYLAIRG